jgi:hypothetical protein
MSKTEDYRALTPVVGVKEDVMKRCVSTLVVLFVLTVALATPALAIGTWPTPESPVMIGTWPTPESPVMIGTWPTPEYPFPIWIPFPVFFGW